MSRAVDRRSLRTWIEVGRAALAHNARTFRSLLPPACRRTAVCKSNACGHELYNLAPALQRMGVDCFGGPGGAL
jgi:alanine racemase